MAETTAKADKPVPEEQPPKMRPVVFRCAECKTERDFGHHGETRYMRAYLAAQPELAEEGWIRH